MLRPPEEDAVKDGRITDGEQGRRCWQRRGIQTDFLSQRRVHEGQEDNDLAAQEVLQKP